jgi:hypothetical protein
MGDCSMVDLIRGEQAFAPAHNSRLQSDRRMITTAGAPDFSFQIVRRYRSGLGT